MADLDELRDAEEEARAAVTDWFQHGLARTPDGRQVMDAYRSAVRATAVAEDEAKRAGLIWAHPWMGVTVEVVESQPNTTVTSECHCGFLIGWHALTPSCPPVYYTAGDLGGPAGAAS